MKSWEMENDCIGMELQWNEKLGNGIGMELHWNEVGSNEGEMWK